MKMLPDARDRCVSICFDEVHLEDRARYSSRWREMVPGETSCVVVVVRGLGSYSFREIVYYAPKNIDRQMLEALIVKVESCNCKVKAVTFDMGNHHLQSQLKIYDGAFFFPNPARPSRPVFIIPDACHRFILTLTERLFNQFILILMTSIMYMYMYEDILQKAPDSEISEQIRKNRAEDKRRWWMDHNDQLHKFPEIIDKIDCCCQLSDVEAQILDDCNSTAFWKFSLPLQVASAGAVYLAIGRGLLSSSSWSSAFPRAPKMIVGAAAGYVAGQYLYLYSKDCSNRYQRWMIRLGY